MAEQGEMGPEVEDIVREWFDILVDMLDKHELATVVSVTRVKGDTATMQMIW